MLYEQLAFSMEHPSETGIWASFEKKTIHTCLVIFQLLLAYEARVALMRFWKKRYSSLFKRWCFNCYEHAKPVFHVCARRNNKQENPNNIMEMSWVVNELNWKRAELQFSSNTYALAPVLSDSQLNVFVDFRSTIAHNAAYIMPICIAARWQRSLRYLTGGRIA